MSYKKSAIGLMILCIAFSLSQDAASAQTSSFTYQGKVFDSGIAANGNYDFQFKLFDLLNAGTQQGTTITLPSVVVTNGIFTVQLDFGAAAFSGANRFLEISLKSAGSPSPYTVLAPRQPISSTPYAIKSLNAATADGLSVACVNCVTSSQIQSVQGSQITGTLPVGSIPPGSSYYIHNSTSQQATSNFNISGNGTAAGTLSANAVSSSTQYNIGGNRVLTVTGNANTVAGIGAGTVTTADSNSFFGSQAGAVNTSGSGNSFFGAGAGSSNSTGFANAFFGSNTGASNSMGSTNSFFGNSAGASNTIGADNSFFGVQAGFDNQSGSSNAFFGRGSGTANTASNNAFFGYNSGRFNTTGTNNAFFGYNAGAANTTAVNNSFFGNSAGAGNTNGAENAFFGTGAGFSNTTGNYNTYFGSRTGGSKSGSANSLFGYGATVAANGIGNSIFGFQAGSEISDTTDNSFFGFRAGQNSEGGNQNTFIGSQTGQTNQAGSDNTLLGYGADLGPGSLTFATAIGAQSVVNASNTIALGRTNGTDKVVIYGLGAAGSTQLCRNASNQISTCSSSLRYKKDLQPFTGGLAVVNRLYPLIFRWKADNTLDVGFGAEDIAKVEPLLVTYNDKGQVEGVKYDRISAALVNAVKEQQTQIEQMQKQLLALKKLLCSTHRKLPLKFTGQK
jgi:hypothetical protein